MMRPAINSRATAHALLMKTTRQESHIDQPSGIVPADSSGAWAGPDAEFALSSEEGTMRALKRSVHDLFVHCLVEAFQVRNLQGAHGLDRHTQRLIRAAVFLYVPSCGPESPQDLRPVKPLPFAM